jgi:hypothetical protein
LHPCTHPCRFPYPPPPSPPQRFRCPLGGSFRRHVRRLPHLPPPIILFSTASMAQALRETAYARWARSLST